MSTIQGFNISRKITGNWKYSGDMLMLEEISQTKYLAQGKQPYFKEHIWFVRCEEILIIFNLNDII